MNLQPSLLPIIDNDLSWANMGQESLLEIITIAIMVDNELPWSVIINKYDPSRVTFDYHSPLPLIKVSHALSRVKINYQRSS